jgi:hypothetical protein
MPRWWHAPWGAHVWQGPGKYRWIILCLALTWGNSWKNPKIYGKCGEIYETNTYVYYKYIYIYVEGTFMYRMTGFGKNPSQHLQ